MCEIGDVELNAARTFPINFNYEGFKKSTLEKMRPEIIKSLNELQTRVTNIPSKYPLISKVGDVYGEDYLMDSNLRWITIIEKPGEAKLISFRDFKEIVKKHKEILIGIGVGPWGFYERGRRYFGENLDNTLMIPLSNVEGPKFGHWDEKEIIVGALNEHFLNENYTYEDSSFLLAVLRGISEGWSIGFQKIIETNWTREKDDYLFSLLKLEELIKK
jgi:hypothetical protein